MNNNKVLNLQHILIQATYCLIGVAVYSYASNFLLSRGYTNTKIGIIISISSLASIIIQPIIATITDNSKKLNVVEVMAISFVAVTLMFIPQLIIKKESIVLTLMFVGVYCLTDALSPLLNIIGCEIEEFGVKSDYGFARAFGSISFALFNGVIGNIINRFTETSIVVSGIVSTLLMVAILVWMDTTFKKSTKVIDVKKDEETIPLKEFISNHKDMVGVFVAIALVLVSENVLSYYLFQIITPLGGTAVDQGYLALMWAMLEVPGMMMFSRIAKKFSIESLLIFSMLIYGLKAIGMYLANSMLMMYITLSFQWGSFALYQPAIVEYINKNTKDKERARGQALKQTICCVGTILTSSLSGFIIDNYGIKTLLFIGMIIALIGDGLLIYFVKKAKNNKLDK